MKIILPRSVDLFYYFLWISVIIHIILFVFQPRYNSLPRFSVIESQSSIEVSLVEEVTPALLQFVNPEIKVEEPIEQKEAVLAQEIEKSLPDQPTIVQSSEATPPKSEEFKEESHALQGAFTQAQAMYAYNPAPMYPREARRKGWEGTVTLKVFVNETGRPEEVSIEESSRYTLLDKTAQETVKTWAFVPAQKGPVKVSSWVMIPVQFTLK